jgi:hypothetical protein
VDADFRRFLVQVYQHIGHASADGAVGHVQ